ncbi:transcriptional regulator containing PAS, AAA-type ATPase, and DNA-binding domains [Desulfoscipio gibsoniae DSM 7213]|uniref:Transcriptional regulator containing PAS, AAA-type ATPase, and DNA-binding domains n=2 Tax=Desulfoscipio gibsoniae TaxID=102134 RepID=R4KNX7_9FIRM|nr:transcriptional regulator containing PAS, AAA-type ATPase, and DNA-binding domains [Desulfoscipio gibsoniae DSM 7213]
MVPVKVSLSPDSTVKNALVIFRKTRLTGIPVVNKDGLLIGIFTRFNLYDCLLQGANLDTSIEDYYLRDVIYFRENKTFNNLTELILWLRNVRIGQTPVVDLSGRPSGVINQAYAVNHLLDHIEILYEELSNIFQQVPCGIVATDELGTINLVSVFLNRIFPDVKVGGHINDFIPNLPFEKIINGVWAGPQRINCLSKDLIVNGLPIIHTGKTKGAILIIQDAAEIDSAKYYNQNELVPQVKMERYDELFKLNGTKYTIESIIGKSTVMADIKRRALQVATSSSTVLISGESGTGKELLAQAIHNASNRAKRSFIKVNCAAIPADIAEAELFGYEGGAFTGALRHGKPGKFELADGGTIFLDEIGDMPLSLQSKLLRVIQEKEVERIGGIKTKKVDVRILAATNRNLNNLVKEGKFRNDLYYRLKVLVITAPPLREHTEDIPLLLDYFISKFSKESGKKIKGVAEDVMKFLMNHRWPGNIRELENMVERAVIYCNNNIIELNDLEIYTKERKNKHELPHGLALSEVTKDAIMKALEITGGNKSRAAKILGISRAALYDKLKEIKNL